MTRILFLPLLLVTGAAAAQTASPLLPDFDPAGFSAPGTNPYWPLVPGAPRRHLGTGVDGEGDPVTETAVLTFAGPGPVILGVQTVTLLDEAWEEGRIVERTHDFFAADRAGNVWYLGEDVENFRYDEAGALIGTDNASAWRAGVNGARPGIAMPAEMIVGRSLFQEHAPAEAAMDHAELVATGLTLTVAGVVYDEVVKFYETSAVEPDLREFKYYAPGVGLIRAEEGLDTGFANPEMVLDLQP